MRMIKVAGEKQKCSWWFQGVSYWKKQEIRLYKKSRLMVSNQEVVTLALG